MTNQPIINPNPSEPGPESHAIPILHLQRDASALAQKLDAAVMDFCERHEVRETMLHIEYHPPIRAGLRGWFSVRVIV